MALLNEINVKGVPHPIVTDDGYYQEMTVGDAEQLVATTFTEDDAPYNFRTAGGAIDIGDRKQVEGLVGGTIAWNQAYGLRNPSSQTINGLTFTVNADKSITVNGTATADTFYSLAVDYGSGKNLNHVHFFSGCPVGGSYSTYRICVQWIGNYYDKADIGYGWVWKDQNPVYNGDLSINVAKDTVMDNVVFRPQAIDLTVAFGSEIADYVYSLEQNHVGDGAQWVRKFIENKFHSPQYASLQSVRPLRHITRGFNAWDGTDSETEKYLNSAGEVITSSMWNITDYIRVVSNMVYHFENLNSTGSGACICWYDANKTFISSHNIDKSFNDTSPTNAAYVRATYYHGNKNDVCINLSWDGERDGEYEEYVEHMYELDPDLELRGIPKLSAGNNLYYDGDVYEPDGTVTRKYGIVDLGELNWTKLTDAAWNCFYTQSLGSSKAKGITNILCQYPFGVMWGTSTDKIVCGNDNNGYIYIRDSQYAESDAAAFKTAMSGVYLVYELAEPTEETADPYNGTQIVDDFGTEEFIDAGVEAGTRDVSVPVGHNSLYQPNLRAKLEMTPEAPEDDGYYVVYHHNGINEYVPLIIPQELPELPTEDGTYTLKCTVASGSATLSFESEV